MELKEVCLTYEERMKERKRIVAEIDEIKKKIEELLENMRNINLKIDEFKNKISDLDKELKNQEKDKRDLENKIKNLEEESLQKGIPVPTDGNFEIANGLLGAKRDINLKLVKSLGEEEIIQVFITSF
jgi:predicted  nucleic acid-binding Zn-ribbon protein